MTFQEAYLEVLDFAQRSSTEPKMVERAKRCVNYAMQSAAMSHPFFFNQVSLIVPWLSTDTTMSMTTFGTDKCGGIVSCEIVDSPAALWGQAVRIVTQEQFVNQRLIQAGRVQSDGLNTFESRQKDNKVIVLTGSSFTIYPLPATDIFLKITYQKLLNEMLDDSDTNFFLTHAPDFIISTAVRKFNFYLKEDERIKLSDDFINSEWESLKRLNANLTAFASTTLQP